MKDLAYVHLMQRCMLALIVGMGLVAVCYFIVDRPVAFFVHDQNLSRFEVLKWFTYPPPVLQQWTPAVLILVAIRRVFGPWQRIEIALFAACVAMVMADQFRETLGFVFGRYWPETWIDNNPSLIKDNAYGFHFFRSGSAYGSFPSGHTTRMAALTAVLWISYPSWRWCGMVATLLVAIGLIGMNYHFTGDVIAGAFLGGIVGAYTAFLCDLYHSQPRELQTSPSQVV